MRVIIARVPQEIADEYAMRLIEQGKAVLAPPEPPEPPVPVQQTPPAEKAERPKGKKPKDVNRNEPKDEG